MPRQLVYASAPSGLAPGRSGYCTVAKSPGLGDRLVRELELISSHEPGEGEAFAFNLLRTAGDTFAVITRFGDAGADYTGRASTIAHHLVYDAAEIAGQPPPADIARRHTGWVKHWEGQPRLLEDNVRLVLPRNAAVLPAATWKRLTGDAGKAALFCDDQGRAKTATLPDPGDADTLALIAEAQLLLEDRGWTTPFTTRRREPDKWAVWHVSASVSLATLPDPGLSRRATLARSGVMAGARPGAAAITTANRPAGYGPVVAGAGKESGKKLSPVAIAVSAGVTVAALGLVAFLLLRDRRSGGREESEPRATAPVAPTTFVPPAKTVHPLVTRALGELAGDDALAAARSWIALTAAAPSEADSARAAVLLPVRDRLVRSTLAKFGAIYDGATAPLPASETEKLEKGVPELRELARKTGSPVGPDDEAALERIATGAEFMRRADAALRPCTIVSPVWTGLTETDFAATASTVLGEAPELQKFLSSAHASLRVTVAGFSGFGAPASAPAYALDIRPVNYVPGKILSGTHPEYKQLLELSFDGRGRLSLLRRVVKSAPEPMRILAADTPVSVVIADTATGESATIILTALDNNRPAIAASAKLLAVKDGLVTPPAWIAGLLGRVRTAGRPALLPAGFNGPSREYPKLEASRAVVEQALRVRLNDPKTQAAERSKIQGALRVLPDGLVSAGAPWSVVTSPPSAKSPLPILRFEAP